MNANAKKISEAICHSLKWDRLEKGQVFSKHFETNIVTDMAILTGIRRASRLGENFFYFNSIKTTHKKFKTLIKQ